MTGDMTGDMLSRRRLVQLLTFAGFAIGLGASAGCSRDGDVAMADVPRTAAGRDPLAGADMFGAFAGSLLGEVLRRTTGNVIFSPWSITVAMAMNRAGAAGRTASQIDNALHVPGTPAGLLDEAVNTGSQLLEARNEKVASPERSGEVALRSANSTWARPDVVWKQTYLDRLARYYGSGVRLTDFGRDPEASREQINAWVADHTEGRITDLIPRGAVDAQTALAVVNAVYFRAPWAQQFDKGLTRAGAFTTPAGMVRQVPMMRRLVETAQGRSGAGWQAATLPYLGETVAMTLVLPDRGKEAAVATWLAGAGIAELLAAPGRPMVEITMPRFDFRTSVELKEILQSLGVRDAFDPDAADYSGMTDAVRLHVSAAVHQATISVDEEGTEATAATAVVAGVSGMPVPSLTLVLDRPFYLVVHDLETRIPIFVGRVADPSERA